MVERGYTTDISNLTNGEVSHLRDYYMLKYRIIKKCCRFQMSKYVIARLDGCARDASCVDYEIYNKTLFEIQFAHHSSGIR
jgi:hypothetical protein